MIINHHQPLTNKRGPARRWATVVRWPMPAPSRTPVGQPVRHAGPSTQADHGQPDHPAPTLPPFLTVAT